MIPALASDTALDMALEEMALFLFMISSNSASLRGVRDASMSLHLHKDTRDILFCSQCKLSLISISVYIDNVLKKNNI